MAVIVQPQTTSSHVSDSGTLLVTLKKCGGDRSLSLSLTYSSWNQSATLRAAVIHRDFTDACCNIYELQKIVFVLSVEIQLYL